MFHSSGKGRLQKKPVKSMVFYQAPLVQPPLFLREKKIYLIFLLEIASLMAETHFTLDPTSTKITFSLLMVIISPEYANIKGPILGWHPHQKQLNTSKTTSDQV